MSVTGGKGGETSMKYFKFTKSWVVQVDDKDDELEAKKLIAADPEKYLETETVTRTEVKKRKQQTDGWGTAVNQLTVCIIQWETIPRLAV